MSTRDRKFLNQKSIHFDVIEYEHEGKGDQCGKLLILSSVL